MSSVAAIKREDGETLAAVTALPSSGESLFRQSSSSVSDGVVLSSGCVGDDDDDDDESDYYESPSVCRYYRPGNYCCQQQTHLAATSAAGSQLSLSTNNPKLVSTRRRNIHLVYVHTALLAGFESISHMTLFDAYILLLAKKSGFHNTNTWVGFAEGITGMTTLLLSVPLGFLADSLSRITLVRTAANIGLLASLITVIAYSQDNLCLLYTNLVLWGVFYGLLSTAGDAVFTESCASGTRSRSFTTRKTLQTSGLAAGPLAAMCVLLGQNPTTSSDQAIWTLERLHPPLLFGCLLAPLACIPLIFLSDPHVNDGVDLASLVRNPLSNSPATSLVHPLLLPPGPQHPMDLRPESRTRWRRPSSSAATQLPTASFVTNVVQESLYHSVSSTSPAAVMELAMENSPQIVVRRSTLVPRLLALSDLLTAIGAGMTVRFFALFFIRDYKFSPIATCILFSVYPLCCASAMPVCQKVGVKIGRAQASFLFQTAGILLLLMMTRTDNLWALVPIFVLRGTAQNAACPLDQSILMDHIPNTQRGKWGALTSITNMTWSGSAVLGGWLADGHDYRLTFRVTAAMYALSMLLYCPLLWLVPREEREVETVD